MTAAEEFAARLAEIQAADVASRNAGGPWKLYRRLPGQHPARLGRLVRSYPTREAAEASLVSLYPAARAASTIRHEPTQEAQ